MSNVKVYGVNNGLLRFLQIHEGLRLEAYDDATGKEVKNWNELKGTLTIGYGHIKNVFPGQTITKSTALDMLEQDIQEAIRLVKRNVKVDLTQTQFNALVSHAYNTGRASENLYRLVNGEKTIKYNGKVHDLKSWWQNSYITNMATGKVVEGLKKRRKAEYNLFTTNSLANNPLKKLNKLWFLIPLIFIDWRTHLQASNFGFLPLSFG